MRIALISDLHANEVALGAVLEDIERSDVDEVVCLGDVATLGPQPEAVIDRLRRMECPCIMGNHDAFLLDSELIHTYTEAPVVVDAVDWCRDQISDEDMEFLGSFVSSLEIELEAEKKLLLFHGSPRSHMEDLLATTPAEDLDVMLDGNQAAVMAGGHTHLQMLRQHGETLLVNPGSVGLPFREYSPGRAPTVLDHAAYAIVEATDGQINVNLRRVPLERHRLCEAAGGRDHPLREMLLDQYS